MTPSPCHHLDLYLDGDLPEADVTAFEAHAEACSECTADLAAARLLEAEWTRLATIPAPAHLVEAALREAKRGPQDRQPVRGSRRRYGRLAGRVTFGVLVIALASAAVWMSRDASPSLQASAAPPPFPGNQSPRQPRRRRLSAHPTRPLRRSRPPLAPLLHPCVDSRQSPRRRSRQLSLRSSWLRTPCLRRTRSRRRKKT